MEGREQEVEAVTDIADRLGELAKLTKDGMGLALQVAVREACREGAAEIRRLREFVRKMGESTNRTRPLCPDHRDKQAGKSCLACEIERLRGVWEEVGKVGGRIQDVTKENLALRDLLGDIGNALRDVVGEPAIGLPSAQRLRAAIRLIKRATREDPDHDRSPTARADEGAAELFEGCNKGIE